MKTLLTIKQQNEFLSTNWQLQTITHKWSCRGYGNSKILDKRANVLSKASGCGYDRFGAAIGAFIQRTFQEELDKLAIKHCKGTNKHRRTSIEYYGLFYNKEEKRAYVDGACGENCMKRILNKIGFDLNYLVKSDKGQTGETFYSLEPISAHNRRHH
jgi:hypothetical protein